MRLLLFLKPLLFLLLLLLVLVVVVVVVVWNGSGCLVHVAGCSPRPFLSLSRETHRTRDTGSLETAGETNADIDIDIDTRSRVSHRKKSSPSSSLLLLPAADFLAGTVLGIVRIEGIEVG